MIDLRPKQAPGVRGLALEQLGFNRGIVSEDFARGTHRKKDKGRTGGSKAPIMPASKGDSCACGPTSTPAPTRIVKVPKQGERMVKLHLQIDRQILKERLARGVATQQEKMLLNRLTQAIKAPTRAATIAALDTEGMEGFFDRIADSLKSGVDKLYDKYEDWQQDRVENKIEKLDGKGLIAFLYAYIPSGDIAKFPAIVRAKRSKQRNAIAHMEREWNFEPGYLKKHIRNQIVKTFGQSPEEIVNQKFAGHLTQQQAENSVDQDYVKGKRSVTDRPGATRQEDFTPGRRSDGVGQLGMLFVAIAGAVATLLTALGGVLKALNLGKGDTPADSDVPKDRIPPIDDPLTTDGGNGGDDSLDPKWYEKPETLLVGGIGVTALSTLFIYLSDDKRR